MSKSWFRAVLILLTFSMAAFERVSEKQCDQAFDHYFSLKMKGTPEVIKKVESVEFERRRAAFLTRCVDRAKPPLIKCWIKAETLLAINECQRDGQMFSD